MEAVVEKKYRSGQTALKPSQRPMLTYDNPYLVPCTLKQERDGFVLTFDTQGLRMFEDVQAEEPHEYLRALANVADMIELQKDYTFSLAPENIMLDLNLTPKALERDMASAWSFMDAYKALIGVTVQPTRSYDEFLQYGRELLVKKPLLEKIRDLNTVEDIKDALLDEYAGILEKQRKTLEEVKRAKVARNRILVPVLSAVTVITLVVSGWFLLYQKPYDDAIIEAYGAYGAGEYTETQEALRNVSIERMTVEVKLMLARAYVHTEGLNTQTRERYLSELTIMAREDMFHYWIYLGRSEYEPAVQCARDLLDNEKLLHALEGYKTALERDTKMKESEKTAILSSVNSEISQLRQIVGDNTDMQGSILIPPSKTDDSGDTAGGDEDADNPDDSNSSDPDNPDGDV